MKLLKRNGNNEGVYITLIIGKKENENWWGAPPDNIDHVGLEYLRDRYPMITTQKRALKFKELYKELWIEKTKITKSDISFLKKLQHEMITQDTVGQADPRFWVVMQEVTEYRVEDDEDGVQIYDTDSCEISCDGNLKDIYDWIEEQEFDLVECEYNDLYGEINIKLDNDDQYTIEDADDLIKFLEELGFSNYEIIKYRVREEIAPNTMFLTLRECKEHIKRNGYHYNKPHPYAMTAWRSPQVERLYKILQETKWDEVKNDEV